MPDPTLYFTVPLAALGCAALLTAFVLFVRRRARSFPSAALLLLAVAIWMLAYALELASPGLAAKELCGKVQFAALCAAPTLWLVYVGGYAGMGRWLPRRFGAVGLSIVPALAFLLLLTDDYHRLIFSRAWLDTGGPFPVRRYLLGLAAKAYAVYAYTLVILGMLLLLQALLRSERLYRLQARGLLLAAGVPFLAYTFDLGQFRLLHHVRLAPLVLGVTALPVAWAFGRLRERDLVPLARETLEAGTGDAMVILDDAGRVIHLNPAAQGLVACDPLRAMGQPVGEVLPGCPPLPEHGGGSNAAQEVALDTRRGRRQFDMRVSDLGDWQGRILAQAVSLRDVTERKRAEVALRDSEERFRIAAVSATDLIYEWNMRTGGVRWFGDIDARLGYGAEEIPRTFEAWKNLVHEDDRARVLAAIKRHLQTREPYGAEYRVVGKDRRVRFWIDRGAVVADKDGRPARWIGVASDITDRNLAREEREKLEAQLREAQRMQAVGLLAGGVAHDLNNQLTVILGNAELALAQTAPEAGHRRELEAIQRTGRRAAHLTRQLLSLGHQEILEPQPLELNGLVRSFVESYRNAIGSQVSIQLDLAEGMAPVLADSAALEQVLLSLALNASDAMPHGGTLRIATAQGWVEAASLTEHPDAGAGEYAVMTVEDTGVGMDEATRRSLFQPLRATGDGGHGLGLAVACGLVAQHQGWIDVQSQPGQGTRFEIYLPVKQAPAPSEAAPAAVPKAIPAFAPPAMLEVEEPSSLAGIGAPDLALAHPLTQGGGAVHAVAGASMQAPPPALGRAGSGDASTQPLALSEPVSPDLGRALHAVADAAPYGDGAAESMRAALDLVGGESLALGDDQMPLSSLPAPGRGQEGGEAATTVTVPALDFGGAEQRLRGGIETILLAEDEAPVLELTRTLLESLGYHVLTATNGEEATQVFAANKHGIDLLLLDAGMPRMSGSQAYEVMHGVRADVPVIFITGYGPDSAKTRFANGVKRPVLQKPFDIEQLLRTVRTVLDERQGGMR